MPALGASRLHACGFRQLARSSPLPQREPADVVQRSQRIDPLRVQQTCGRVALRVGQQVVCLAHQLLGLARISVTADFMEWAATTEKLGQSSCVPSTVACRGRMREQPEWPSAGGL